MEPILRFTALPNDRALLDGLTTLLPHVSFSGKMPHVKDMMMFVMMLQLECRLVAAFWRATSVYYYNIDHL